MCDHNSIPSYSIALGIVLYAGIYVYLLYNNSAVSYMFNKFLIYIVSIDLLLSTLYFYKSKPEKLDNIEYQPIAQYDLHNFNVHNDDSDNDDVTEESGLDNANEVSEIVNENDAEVVNENEAEIAHASEVVNEDELEIDTPELNETPEVIQNDLDLTQTIEETDQENPRKRRGRPPKQSIAL
jgi:CRISPR/Cas system CMR-associated protein Cmr5 small subunit